MDPNKPSSAARRLLDLVYDEDNPYVKYKLFVCSAGNSLDDKIIFPANLANDFKDRPWTIEIPEKTDISNE